MLPWQYTFEWNTIHGPLLFVYVCMSYRPHGQRGDMERIARGLGQRGGHSGAPLSRRWEPPSTHHFQPRTSENSLFFSFIWTRFFWMGGCKPLRRSGHSRRLAQTMCFICSGWTEPYWFATLSMCLICICFHDNMTKGQQWFSNVSNGRPK